MPDRSTPALATLALHGGRDHAQTGEPIVPPIFQGVNFAQEVGTAEGMRYSRYGNNPNAEIVQRRLALLEGAEAALVLASGMGATACALLALVRPGDHVISSAWIYGGTRALLADELAGFGVAVTFVNPDEPRSWRGALRPETRAVFVETPVNPTCRVLDLDPIASMTRASGIALVVDSTFASPINFRPLEHGADVVIHSATKYLNGHHDVLAGAVVGTASYIEEVRRKMIIWGQAPDPFSCWLLERGIRTLDVRIERHNANAQRVAEWCEGRAEISRVHYPGLASHPDHAVARRTLRGFGGMMALELGAGGAGADRFLRALRLIHHAPSLGGVDSLVSEPRFTSHPHLSPAQRAEIGIPDGFLRFSIGIEDAGDLIDDIEQALGS
ncbi:MAG: PLP-dependent aspartate aminotransferase family protein [Gemmatimonadaceae bacterium]